MFRIEADVKAVLAALDKLGPAAEAHHKRAAKETAQAIMSGAKTRRAASAGPFATGDTERAITMEEQVTGYIVFVGPTPRPPMLPWWLEKGTRYMRARPFLFDAGRAEEGPHLRRVEQAMQNAIDEVSR